MNAFKVAKLARENNEVLKILDNRWATPKSKENKHPVPDLVKMAKGNFFYGLALLSTVAAFVSLRLFVVYDSRPMLFMMLVFFAIAIVWMFLLLRHARMIKDAKSCNEFSRAVLLLEQIYSQLRKRPAKCIWNLNEFNSLDCTEVQSWLRGRADTLKQLEKYSWRKPEETKFRERFDWELGVLCRLMLVSSRRDDYFTDPPGASAHAGR